MKPLFLLSLFLMLSLRSFPQNNTDYKKPALDILSETYSILDKKTSNLTHKELNYNPKDGGWTILNCLEHLATVEKVLFSKLKELIDNGETKNAKDLSENDWLIVAQVTDRTNKVKTPPVLEPKDEMKNKGKIYFLNEIKTYRDKSIDLIQNAKVDLRKITGPYLYGEADAIQQAIIIGAHCYRHINQIEEILKESHVEHDSYNEDEAMSTSSKTIIFPPDLEEEIALSALPEHLREDCGVYIFNDETGFELKRESKNGHIALVQRIPGMNNAFIPVSYDAAGRNHQIKRILQIGKWIANDITPDEIREKVQQGFKDGTFTPPTTFGISYMLSPVNLVPSSPVGRPAIYYPHYMIYAPNLTNEDLDLPDFRWHSYQPFVNNVGPHGNLIIRLGERETEEIKEKHKALITKVEKFLGKKLSELEVPRE